MTSETAIHLFVSMAALLAVAKSFGALARRVGQPAVVGEILAGIAIGPLVLPESVRTLLLPGSIMPLLGALSAVGLALFMFVVGYELDGALLRGRGRATLGVASGSVLLPLVVGALVAVPLATTYAPGSRLGFILFLGIAMSVTAFPVLARILADRQLNRGPLGGVTLAAAAVGDLAAWLALAAVAALCGTADQWRVSLLPVYLLLLTLGVRPLLGRLLRRYAHHDRLPAGVLSLLASGLLLSCAATEWMGVHYIFGAFAFGAAMPRAGLGQFRTLVIQGMDQAGALLLPLYFIVAGSKVDLTGFGGTQVLTLLALIAVACLTKTVGAYTGARIAGMPRDMALPIAALMNVRGLTEIVLLSVGLELHLIDDRIYSMMVVMAVVTTAMAGGLLKAFRVRSHEAPSAAATAPGLNEGTASGAKHMMLK